MRQHKRNERTRYEFVVADQQGNVVFTIWFLRRSPSLRMMYEILLDNVETIKEKTGAEDVIWNGDRTITAGDFTGKMTGKTLLQTNGYNQASYS